MTRFLGVSALALLSGLAPASAADLSYKDAPTASILPSSLGLSGLYVEVGVGYGFSQSEVANLVTLSSTGTEFEGRIGYDKKIVGNWGLGIYGEAGNGFNINGKLANLTFGNQWNWGVGAKMFYDHGNGQIYGLLGFTHSDVDFDGPSKGLDGYKYGGGITLKVMSHAYVGMEFTQSRFVDATVFTLGAPLSLKQTDDRGMIRLGIPLSN